MTPVVRLPSSPEIAELIELQRQRVFCIISQSRCDRSCEAFMTRYMGYRPDLPEAQRREIWTKAGALRKRIEKEGSLILTGAAPVPVKKKARGRVGLPKGQCDGAASDSIDSGQNLGAETLFPPAAIDPLVRSLGALPDEGRSAIASDADTRDRFSLPENRIEDVPDVDAANQNDVAEPSINVSGVDEQKVIEICLPIVLNSAQARSAYDALRDNVESRMRVLARTLPVWDFVKPIRGFSELGLAVLVAEAGGDLRNYASVARLWKRLGLAVIDGERQQRRRDADLAAKHGFSPSRRAEIWAMCDSMFRHQWRGDKDADGKNPAITKKPVAELAHALGPYGAEYARRKAATAERDGWTPKHRDMDARRIASKLLVEDIWTAWHRATLTVDAETAAA